MPGIDIATTEKLLRERLAEAEEQLETLAAPPERGSNLHFGKRVGDGTTEAIARMTEIGVGESVEAVRDRILHALDRIAEGEYGTCESCGEAIDPRRLEAAPESTFCIDCARAAPRA